MTIFAMYLNLFVMKKQITITKDINFDEVELTAEVDASIRGYDDLDNEIDYNC